MIVQRWRIVARAVANAAKASPKTSFYRVFSTATPRLSNSVKQSNTMGRPKVYITRQVPQEGLDLLKHHCDIAQWDSTSQPVPRDELMKNVVGVDGLFCLLTDTIDDDLLESAGEHLLFLGSYKRLNTSHSAERSTTEYSKPVARSFRVTVTINQFFAKFARPDSDFD